MALYKNRMNSSSVTLFFSSLFLKLILAFLNKTDASLRKSGFLSGFPFFGLGISIISFMGRMIKSAITG